MVEPQIVDLVVAGSNPVSHPLCASSSTDRASDFGSAGCRFDSCLAHIFFGPLAQLVEQQTLNLWVKGSIPLRLIHNLVRGSGEIGIHAGFRFQYRKVWGFKSPLPQEDCLFDVLFLFFVKIWSVL